MSNGKVIAQLESITKDYDGVQILKPTNLSIYEGEFLTFLGPSGCGKTTTLRIIAGLETPTEGTVILEGRDVTNLPPYKRNVNTVFQNYALFPNMNVFDNVAFGLVEKRLGKAEIHEKVDAMLQLVQLGKMGKRKPNQLSGGQKQRVAIARALANDPKLLLLDEPLGALDLKLRKQMQLELKTLQKNLGITFVYVTHDQEEALTMSDRIVVMNNGKFEQPEGVALNSQLVEIRIGESKNNGWGVAATATPTATPNKSSYSVSTGEEGNNNVFLAAGSLAIAALVIGAWICMTRGLSRKEED